jgi:hypothetical protein
VGALRPLCNLYHSAEGFFPQIAQQFINSMLAKELLQFHRFV